MKRTDNRNYAFSFRWIWKRRKPIWKLCGRMYEDHGTYKRFTDIYLEWAKSIEGGSGFLCQTYLKGRAKRHNRACPNHKPYSSGHIAFLYLSPETGKRDWPVQLMAMRYGTTELAGQKNASKGCSETQRRAFYKNTGFSLSAPNEVPWVK